MEIINVLIPVTIFSDIYLSQPPPKQQMTGLLTAVSRTYINILPKFRTAINSYRTTPNKLLSKTLPKPGQLKDSKTFPGLTN